MDYSTPVVGWLGRFKKPGPEAERRLTGRATDETYDEVKDLAKDMHVSISDIMTELIRLGLKKYYEEVDRYLQAQKDLRERLEALGYDDLSINGMFETHHDLSELHKKVVELEAKRKKH